MKKISLILFLIVSKLAISETVVFSDPFSNLNNWNNTDLTGANPTNGIWKMINGSTDTLVWFQSYAINAAQTDYVNDGLPENGALSLKNALNCSSHSKVFIDFESIFQYPTGGNTTPNTLGRGYLEISTNNSTWTTALTLSANEAVVRRLDISTWAANQSNVYIRFRYQSNFSGYWQLNNLKVYSPDKTNLGVFNLTSNVTERELGGVQFLSFRLYNYGSDTVKNVSLEFKPEASATPETMNLSVSIPPLSFVDRMESLMWNCPVVGIFNTNLAIKTVNSTANSNVNFTQFNKLALVYGNGLIPRRPLFEVFTSSTCPPCKPGNENLHGIIDAMDSSEYNVLKFQQDFPGTGDPYATNELVARRNFYGINSIPRMEIDGQWDGNANSFTQALYDEAVAKQSFFDIKGTFTPDTVKKEISVNLDIKPLSKLFTGIFRVHYAVVERTTTKNKKSNGETHFDQVVKKMLPNENGTLIENISSTLLNANTTFTHNIVYSQKGNYRLPLDGTTANRINLSIGNTVENFNNLYVVAWVEASSEKLILQSARLTKSTTGGGGSTGTLSVSDSAFKSVDSNASLTVSNQEISKTRKLTAGKEYTWHIVNTTLPSYWSLLSVCDKFDCYFLPIIGAKKFTADADSTKNFFKIDIQHNKKTGYGYVVVALYDKADSAATVKTTKYSLLVKKGTSGGGGTGSVVLVEDAKDFYYSDNKIYFTGDNLPIRFNILSIDGKQISNQTVNSSIENVSKSISKGVYLIEVEYKDKPSQVLKVRF